MTQPKAFIFRNRDLTIPANTETKEWLIYMVANFPDDLKFLFKKSQEYVRFGGANAYVWAAWLKKLKRDLAKEDK